MEILQPKLRFPNFDEKLFSKKIGDICDLSTGNKDTQNKVDDGKYPFFVRSQTVERINSFCYDGEAILTSGDGVGVGKNFHYINGKFDYHQRVYCLHKFKDGIFGKYVYHYFSEKFLKRITRMNAKNSVDSVRREMIFDMPIFIPSFEEQTKIANFLSEVDEKLNLLKEKKSLLEDYKKGIMQKIFNQEIRFKDDNGNDFEDWEENVFSNYIKLYRGSSPRPIVKYTTNSENGINWIKIGDTKGVENYILETVSEKITKEGAKHSRNVNVGEIILANSMSFGKSYILNIAGCIYDGWFVLREYEKFFDKMFLIQLLNSDFLQKQYKTLSTGGVVQNINSDIVYSTFLFKPSLSEQSKIANFFSAIDEKIKLVSNQIQNTQEYKEGLLQQMFV